VKRGKRRTTLKGRLHLGANEGKDDDEKKKHSVGVTGGERISQSKGGCDPPRKKACIGNLTEGSKKMWKGGGFEWEPPERLSLGMGERVLQTFQLIMSSRTDKEQRRLSDNTSKLGARLWGKEGIHIRQKRREGVGEKVIFSGR